MAKFKNKVVFITGASAGIGAELAKEFAREGAHLVLCARRVERLHELASELSRNGTSTLVEPCDVTKEGDIERVVQAAIQKWGRMDVVVANAGFGVAGPIDKLKLDDYRRQFETNVFGVLRTIYATLDQLKANKGILMLIGSAAGYIGLPGSSPYSMSKFAIHSLANSIYYELKSKGVGVVLIAPGFVKSEIRRVDNQGQFRPQAEEEVPEWLVMPTEKAARQIVAAAACRRRELIVTFHAKVAIFVQRHFPRAISALVRFGLRGRHEPK